MKDKTGTNNKAKKLSDLVPDNKNANKGSQRGRGLLEKSLRQFGAGRSLLIDKNNNVLAGNKTLEIAAELDLKIKTVETDGTELVVVKRTDLDIDSAQGRGLAIADNRAGEVGLEWDDDVLLELSKSGMVDLSEYWREEEVAKLLDEPPIEFPEYGADIPVDHQCPRCGFKWSKNDAKATI